MKKSLSILSAAYLIFAAASLSATPASAGFFDDVVKGLTGVFSGSGR